MWHCSAQPSIIFVFSPLQNLCWPPQAHPPQLPPQQCNIITLDHDFAKSRWQDTRTDTHTDRYKGLFLLLLWQWGNKVNSYSWPRTGMEQKFSRLTLLGLWVQYKQLGGQCTRTVRWGQGYFSQQICHFSEHKWQITWNILSLATEGGKLARTFPNWSEVWTSSAQCNFNLNQCQSSSNMTQTLCEMSRESDDSSSQIPREGEVNSIRNKKRFFILAKIWK